MLVPRYFVQEFDVASLPDCASLGFIVQEFDVASLPDCASLGFICTINLVMSGKNLLLGLPKFERTTCSYCVKYNWYRL